MFDFSKFNDFGHYGIYDGEDALYPEVKVMLEGALKSGKDFDTGWHSFKHEFQSIMVKANGERLTVFVAVEMDEPEDLVWDCDPGDLTDDQAEEVLSIWFEDGWSSWKDDNINLPRNSSLSDVIKAATELSEECSQYLEDGFQAMQDIIKDFKGGKA